MCVPNLTLTLTEIYERYRKQGKSLSLRYMQLDNLVPMSQILFQMRKV